MTPTEVDPYLRTFYAGRPLARGRAMPHLAQSQHVAHTSYRDVGSDLRLGRKRVVPISCLGSLLRAPQDSGAEHGSDVGIWRDRRSLMKGEHRV